MGSTVQRPGASKALEKLQFALFARLLRIGALTGSRYYRVGSLMTV